TPAKTFDTSGKSPALVHHHAIRKTLMAPPDNGRFGAIAGKTLPTTESQHARCLLLFDDRTFGGDVRSSEMCQRRKSLLCPITRRHGCDDHSGSPACRNPSPYRARSSARR